VRVALTRKGALFAEEGTVRAGGVSLADLLERAGASVAAEVSAFAPAGPVIIFAGIGNNGGDGWVAARHLVASGREVTVYCPADPALLRGIAGEAARRACAEGARSVVAGEGVGLSAVNGAAVLVDAIFGIGYRPERITDPYRSWIAAINESPAPVIAVDIASGVDADTGSVVTEAVRADVTVALTAPKIGSLVYPGAANSGTVITRDIGVPVSGEALLQSLELWDAQEYAAIVPVYGWDTHKNSRGRVAVIAGSGAYPGAAVLTAAAAQRAGAGYVLLVVPESIVPIVQSMSPSIVVVGVAEGGSKTFSPKAEARILDMTREFDSVVIGPGMTVSRGAALLARRLVASLDKPMVIDADGLNALVGAVHLLENRQTPKVITPHPGELARLLGLTSARIQAGRPVFGARLASACTACVLKGARSLISCNGRQVLNLPGGPELATAGTGDVLAGIIGTLLAQGVEPLNAGALGAYLHGMAATLGARELTERCMRAEDIFRFLPKAFSELLAVSAAHLDGLRCNSGKERYYV